MLSGGTKRYAPSIPGLNQARNALLRPVHHRSALTTAILVVLQFGLALTWGFAERSTTHLMIVTNMSLGILLATVLVVRIGWRLMPGHGVASKTVHFLLYILLVAQATSGFVLRRSGNEAMSFFGVLIPPTVAPFSKPAHEIVYVR